MSRAKTAAGLYIVGNLKLPGKLLLERDPVFRELKRLRENCAITWSIPTISPDICVLNIRSLNKHLKDIACDPILYQSSMLILQETMTIELDDNPIPGYNIITRIDGKQRIPGSGSIVYCKNGEYDVFLTQLNDDSKARIEYIGVQFRDPKTQDPIQLLSVYRSPNSKLQQCIHELTDIIKNVSKDISTDH